MPPPTERTFSPARFEDLRTRAGVSRTAVAYRLLMTEQGILMWERGRVVSPPVQKLAEAARLFDCQVEDFYEEDGHAS